MTSAPRIDVVVATRDRVASLRRCIDALAVAAARHGTGARVIVVDNGSAPLDAAAFTHDAAATLEIVVVREPRPGLSNARNAGLVRADADIVAFTDDDCLVEPDWLATLARLYREMPDVDAIGGWVGLADPLDRPVSIRTGSEPLDIVSSPQALAHLIGCNFSVRRATLSRVGPFDPRLGAGTAVQAAEDLDLFNRLLKSGARMRYEPALRLLHAHGRREPGQIAALSRGYAVGRGAFYAKHILGGDGQIALVAWWELRSLLARRRWPLLADLARGAWLRLTGR